MPTPTPSGQPEYEIQALGGMSTEEGCSEERHYWRPFVGDPVPITAWVGVRCKCLARVLRLVRCECGHEHLHEVLA